MGNLISLFLNLHKREIFPPLEIVENRDVSLMVNTFIGFSFSRLIEHLSSLSKIKFCKRSHNNWYKGTKKNGRFRTRSQTENGDQMLNIVSLWLDFFFLFSLSSFIIIDARRRKKDLTLSLETHVEDIAITVINVTLWSLTHGIIFMGRLQFSIINNKKLMEKKLVVCYSLITFTGRFLILVSIISIYSLKVHRVNDVYWIRILMEFILKKEYPIIIITGFFIYFYNFYFLF